MNKGIIVIVSISVCLASSGYSQTEGFQLKGNIAGLKDGTTIYLVKNSESRRGLDTVLITKSKGSGFTFRGAVDGDANYYFLKTPEDSTSNALWLVNKRLSLKGSLDKFKELQLKGSEAHTVWVEFKQLKDEMKNSSDEEFNAMKLEFIKTHSNSLFTPFLLTNMKNVDELYQGLSPAAQQSYWGLKAKKKAEWLESILERSELPDILVKTIDGKEESIQTIISRSKYTLIDIWASWCKPCRASFPKLKKVFDEFKSAGLNIVGVNFDKDKTDWLKAIEQDNNGWTEVWDPTAKFYSAFDLRAVPGYILVDDKGKIIQTELYNVHAPVERFADKKLPDDLADIFKRLLASYP